MIGVAIAKRPGMRIVIGVNKTIGHAAKQQAEPNAESEGYRFRARRMVEAADKPCDQGPEVNQREKNAETEM